MKESKTLEFKSGKTSSFLKTVSAYANYGVGTIEFGRQDNGEIKGIDNPDQFCLDIENMINDSIHPKPNQMMGGQGHQGGQMPGDGGNGFPQGDPPSGQNPQGPGGFQG